ncbi:MAG: adenylate/guanylate cyclase domain-containing protein [Gammaproteobacteria bacterium]|nr:adenylate/guanylate cyclase domain-containing protein [Gammaproteobacteria bacterium]
MGPAAEFSPISLNLIGLLAIGLGSAFYWLDRKERTSQMLGLFLCSIGLSVLAGVNFLREAEENLRFYTALMAIPTTASFIFGPEWIRAVRARIPAGHYDTRFGDRLLQISQIFGITYMAISLAMPEKHYALFINGVSGNITSAENRLLLLIGLPMVLSVISAGFALLITFRRDIPLGEQRRLLGFGLSVPFLAAGLVVGAHQAAYVMLVGQLFLIVGAIQYHILQAQRGDFMQRFLPSQVVQAMDENQNQLNLETGRQKITVVACDLRKFTPYAEKHDSEHVIGLLRAYYKMVGEAAAEHGATIKDYAGDGVLMLVGAPLAYTDHADRGVRLAQVINERSVAFLDHWNDETATMGLGIGVSTGEASVGVVGDERLEYAAVGPAINRASRLCDKAKNGEVLIDDLTVISAEEKHPVEQGSDYILKGMSETVQTWVFKA